MNSTASTFKRNRALFLFLSGLIVVCAVIYVLREPLLPFFIGFVIAYLVLPIVDWIDKKLPLKGRGHEARRIIIVLVVFLVILALLGLIAFFVVSSFIGSFTALLANAPTLIAEGLRTFAEWLESLVRNLAPEQQKQAHDFLNNVGAAIGTWLQEAFVSGIKFIPATFTFVIGFLTLPFFLVLFMANFPALNRGFYALFSSGIAYHLRNFIRILDNVFGRYIRAQLLLAVVMGFLVYLALLVIGIDMAAALALVAAVFQLVPAIGGALAAIVGCIVTLAVEPAQILWVIVAYVVINLAFGSVLIAKFQGSAARIDASLVMVLIVIGGYVGGILGMILITPIVAILYAFYLYVRDELRRSQLDEAQT